ncbi:hypothetical protein V6N12_028542 [Hibiscus sabdariffa]|uniref:Uncharacterized protein n=1 Tax=Hibiscus sabdariffa TaxID=183260 RepID=A0ABR2F654_9ROSI
MKKKENLKSLSWKCMGESSTRIGGGSKVQGGAAQNQRTWVSQVPNGGSLDVLVGRDITSGYKVSVVLISG